MSNKYYTCPVCGNSKIKSSIFGYYTCPLCDSRFKFTDDKKETRITDTSELYKSAVKSVVEIYNFLDDDELSGTGIIIDKKGHVLTSAHIVTKIKSTDNVTNFNDNILIKKDADGNSLETTTVSFDKTVDLALLKTDKESDGIPVKFSNKPINVGEHIYVIGNSKGEGLCIVDGIVSDNHRMINTRELFMISAPVTTGCSGAPVLNQYGELIGIVTGGREGASAMNYAIPLNVIKSFLKNTL